MEADGLPLPHPDDREGYFGSRHFDFWLSGLYDWWKIRQQVAKHGGAAWTPERTLELGCASGRVLRHFICQAEKHAELVACDINLRHVEWVRKHLGNARTRVFQNSVLPSLPLADDSIDVVYAFSVFTHIDEFELTWLAELRRLLRNGGLAYLTVHTEHTWSGMNPNWSLWRGLVERSRHVVNRKVSAETFQHPMSEERVVFEWRRSGHYRCNVFHHTDYIREAWGSFFEIVDVLRQASDYQDVVVLRKS